MGPTGVEGLSTCTPCPTGPVLDRRVTDDIVAMFPLRSMTEPSQCMKMAYITAADVPSLAPMASGGTVPDTAIGFGASNDLLMVRFEFNNVLSVEIGETMPAVEEVQLRAAAVIMGDAFARYVWLDPPDVNFAKNMPYFAAQNPNGVSTPSAGVGASPTRRELLCLRRSIEPHGADARIVFVMNTAMLDSLDRTAYQDGYPLDWKEDVDGSQRPHLSGIPIVLSDHIAAMEPGGGSSVYALRLPSPNDAFGNDGVYLMAPPGETGVQVYPCPASATNDQRQTRVQMNRMLVVGSRTFVARTTGFGA